MNEDANDIFKSLMAKANRNLINECAELRAKLQAADHRAAIHAEAVDKLTESAEKWAIDAARESERADAAEARVKELEEDNARYAFCVTHLKRELANALEQGGAK